MLQQLVFISGNGKIGWEVFIHFAHTSTITSLFISVNITLTLENHKLFMLEEINRNKHIIDRHTERWKIYFLCKSTNGNADIYCNKAGALLWTGKQSVVWTSSNIKYGRAAAKFTVDLQLHLKLPATKAAYIQQLLKITEAQKQTIHLLYVVEVGNDMWNAETHNSTLCLLCCVQRLSILLCVYVKQWQSLRIGSSAKLIQSVSRVKG